jgi:hypothetical protein
MSDKDLKNKRLDAAMKNVLLAAVSSDEEIDDIASKPFLYASIRSRIEAEQKQPKADASRRFAPAFAVLAAIVLMGAAGAFMLNGDSGEQAAPVAAVEAPAVYDVPPVELPETARPLAVPVVYSPDKVRSKTVYRKPVARKEQRRPVSKPRRTPLPDLPDTFFALNYHGVSDETVGGGRVVRVNMPRASLFAMGVNLPLENESASVEADVMLGPDGVARAIRLVD